MVIKLKQNDVQKDIEILITYPKKNKFIERIVTYLNSMDTQISGYLNNELYLVNASDINYIEYIDRKTIINCDENNFITNEPLYQIYDKLKSAGFIQINKYCITNLSKLKNIKQLSNSHLEAILKNGTCLYVTRKYLNNLKNILKEMC
jgi:DNA-binding LytR/AlgR family response regulator